jgi:hypothetical protein
MRLILPVVFAMLVLSAGCLETSSTRTRDDNSVTCVDGVCEACIDDVCAECEEGQECDDCLDGDCPVVDEAQGNPSAPPQDVDVQQTYDLSMGGMPETSWTFDVAAGASGHAHLVLRDVVTKERVVMGGVCVSYDITGPNGSQSQGSQGGCSGAAVAGQGVAGGTTTDQPIDLLGWDELREGHYSIRAQGPQQPDELVVDIVVDNP